MDLSKILAVSGKAGLFKHVGQSKTGIVIESLIDGKRASAFASDQVSALSDISIFTNDDDVKLEEVFKKIFDKEEGKETIKTNSSSNEIKALFDEILPDYDKDRVYVSDMKKVIKWYNILAENNLIEFKDKEEAEINTDADTNDDISKEKKETKKKTKAKPKVKPDATPGATKKAEKKEDSDKKE